MISKLLNFSRKNSGRLAAWVVSLVTGACAALSVIARFLPFWTMPHLQQVLIVGSGAAVLALPLFLLLQVFWRLRTDFRSPAGRVRLVIALLVGLGCWMAADLAIARIPTRHTLTVEVLPIEDASGPRLVNILEVRGPDGEIVKPDKFSMSGDWRVTGLGSFSAEGGDQPVKLTHTFYEKNGKDVQALIEKNPQGGRALFTVDGVSQLVDFNNGFKDQQILHFPLSSTVGWVAFVRLADFVVSIGIISVLLFVVSSFTVKSIVYVGSLIHLKPVSHDAAFMAVLLILLMLPLYQINTGTGNFDNRFWFRAPLLQSWANFRLQALGDHVFKMVIVGKGNWLILADEGSLNDYQNTISFPDESLEIVQQKLDGFNARMKAKGITFLIVVPPNKNTIYPEYLPAEIPVMGRQSLLDRMIEYQKLHGQTQILDLRPALEKARNERQVYYATDTHWNPYGALIGYQEILRALQPEFPSLQPHSLEDYQYVDDGIRNGEMGRQLGQITMYERYFHLNWLEAPGTNTWNMKDLQENGIVVTSTPDPTLPRLVMYRDSFTTSMIPFLSAHFSRAVYLMQTQIDEKYIDAEKPDIVILEVTERYLASLLYLFK